MYNLGEGILVDDTGLGRDLMVERLRKLPLPCAVFCTSDIAAVELIELALSCGLRVPEDLAILGCNNNELACDASPIPLSTIDLSLSVRAREAAMKLDDLMNGKESAAQEHEYRVRGLIANRSSDETVFEHAGFKKALGFIKARYAEQITAEEVAQVAGLSRRALERHFRTQLDRTITDEIHRRRIRQAKALLLTSQHPVNKIAGFCGYNYPQSFHKNFLQSEAVSPAKFRDRYR